MENKSKLTIPDDLSHEDNAEDPCLSSVEDSVKDRVSSDRLIEKVMASDHPDDRRLLAMIVPSTEAKAKNIHEEQKEKDSS